MDAARIQAKVWQKGYGVPARIIGTPYQFYRPGNPPIPTGSMDTPGRKWDSGKSFDPNTGLYDQVTRAYDTGGGYDTGADPDTIDQTKLDAPGASMDDGLNWDQPGNLLFTLPVSLNAEDMSYGKPNKYGKATWYALVDGTDLEVGLYFKGAGGTFFIAAMQALLPIYVVECNRTVLIARPQTQTGVGIGPYGGNTDNTQDVIVYTRPCSILLGTKGEKSEAGLPGDTRSPWVAILMPYAGVDIRTDDTLIDDLGKRYTVSGCEQTDAGYRITAMQDVP